MLKIQKLQFSYPKNQELYCYDLEVHPSEIVLIVGQSGSGKSTFFNLLSGFLKAKQGSISFDGKELCELSVQERPLSILFQSANLFEHLSVEKNILLGLSQRLRHTAKEKAKVAEILKEVGLERFGDSVASSLSGGQQQRVALARVLIRQEPILLLDEPFTGLDEKTRLEMLHLVEKITQTYRLCTLMISHERQESQAIATQTYALENFRLVKQ